MTEQETRENIKIIITTILQSRPFEDGPFKNIEIGYVTACDIADALIAVGLGFKDKHRVFVQNAPLLPYNDDDVYFVPNTQPKITQLYGDEEVEKIVKEREEYKHRAEVAERALDLCETAYILSLNHRATEGISGQAIASDLGIHKFFMEQAEKELAEEGKDGEKI